MNRNEITAWWQERLAGLEVDVCPAVDLPDNEEGGALISLTVPAEDTDRDRLTAALAYTLAKFTSQTESLFWVREDGAAYPFYISFDEETPAEEFRSAAAGVRADALAHASDDEASLADALSLSRDILLSWEAFSEEASCGEWKLCFVPSDGGLTLLYREGWYLAENMRRLAETVVSVAGQLSGTGRLRGMNLIGDGDLALLETFPHWELPPSAESVPELLKRSFEKYPDHRAVVYEGEALTYRQLDRKTDAIAAKLAAEEIGRGCVVSTLIPRCKWMPVAAVAILKTGAAYQPLDPSYPPERLNFMVQDSGASLVIADRALAPLLSEYGGPFLFLDELDALPDAEPLSRDIRPDDPFILLYTSGTTGTPKGVILHHANLVNFIDWYVPKFRLTPESRSAAYASFGFDANMMDTYPTLAAGAEMHILSDEVRFDLRAINRYFNENGITHSFMTTQVGRQFALTTDCRTLRVISMGGEALVPFDPPSGIEVYNLYGPTECTILSTAYRMTSGSKRLPIGTPLNNTRLYVADAYQRLLPVGAMGELLIAGAQVGTGYLNRPEKTAEAFIANPFTDDPSYSRLYRTGDIVRWGNDGNIEFVGRRDGQVKIRGFRIELTEVERVLREFDGIADATVIARDAPAGGKMICAYVVSPAPVDIKALEAFILERKPSYMVPAVTMQIEKIPLNVNGKVDKRALPEPAFAADEDEESGPRARTELEEKLYGILSPILGTEDFPVEKPLEDLGLTSISALMLAVDIEDAFGYSPDVDVLARGSLLSIENAIVGHFMEAPAASQSSPVRDAEGPWPLTQTQLGIYSACMMDPDNDAYQLPFLFRVSADTDTARLCRALEETIAAHPVLGCRIVPDREHTAVMIASDDDFRAQTEEISEDALTERMKEHVPFDFANAPLYRAKVYRTEEAVYLYLNVHHIIFDGTSLALFMEDLERAFEGEAPETEKYTAFDLARDEREARAGQAYADARAYYDSVFSGVDVNSLPDADFPGGEPEKEHARKRILDEGMAERVQKWCAAQKVTENAFFTFALAYTLARTTGQDEALFCSIYNGRSDPRTFRTVGMLVKTYPFHIRFTGAESPSEMIRETARRIRDLTAGDLYSFAEVSRAYGIRPDILFAYQGSAFNEFTVAGQRSRSLAQTLDSVQAPLSVDVFLEDGTYSLNAEYDPERYTGGMIGMFLELYAQVARQLLEVPTLDAIDLMNEKGQAVLDSANDTDWPVAYRPAHCLLEASAAAHPDRVAVITPDCELTYAELNARANRVAHGLIDLGIGPDRIAALMLPRCAEVYMVRQGILKAGGAFLSIDPEYPDDRIEVMATDAEAAVLVTNRTLMKERGAFLSTLPCAVVAVEDLLTNADTTNPEVYVPADSLAYTIFTSGSTGKPKGVLLTQGNLVNFVDANPKNGEILGYTERAHVSLALAAITFDVSVMEEFIPLANGMTICMASEEEIHNPAALAELMIRHHVDMMTCTPSFLSNCIGLSVMKPALVNVVSYDLGAEAFPAALLGKICAINPDAYIMNGYGPTEATISCTMDVVTNANVITIGRPAGNVKAYILSPNGRILPPLVPGELVIAGAGVGRGYVKRDDLTAEKFITLNGLPAYRTGDIASWTADGKIRFKGRTDNQVKLRGLRVELGEIESAINAADGVLTSIVVMTGEENNQFLAGYYTASREISPAELKAEISKTLTPYMVPGVLVQLDRMPLTANGKIDKKKLPKVEYAPSAEEYAAPSTPAEEDFCAWFAEVLNMDRVSAEGNFFELGGTSLSAAIIALNAADRGYPIVYADIFKAQTPRALAALAAGGEPAAPAEDDADDLRSFDYSSLKLAGNTEDKLPGLTRTSVGDLLLTGATGFLGIHVLHEYLMNGRGRVTCLLRGETPEKHLRTLYFYYFDEPLDPYFENGRVRILHGDITDRASLEAAKTAPFDTLINCAALVKHFVRDDSLEQVNFHGVENLIALCEETCRRLIQVSTVSVAGEGLDGEPPRSWMLTENALYNGQLLDNQYALTKFKAEKAVLEAVGRGLDAKIMRLGNLMGRASDGEFQVNFRSNAFIRSLASYKAIGAVPYSVMNAGTDFSEIDMTARAILLLSGTSREFTVFHPMNNHTVTYADIVYAMREYGFSVDALEDEDFERRQAEAGDTSGALIAYQSREGSERRYELGADCSFTASALYRLGFKWPVSGEKYIVQMIRALDELTMFED